MSRGKVFPTTRIDLGPCDCPGAPHTAGDWAVAKDRYLFGDLRAISNALKRRFIDPTGYQVTAIERGIVEWNLLGEKGVPLPITADSVDTLSVDQGRTLVEWFSPNEGDAHGYAAQLARFEGTSLEEEPADPKPVRRAISGWARGDLRPDAFGDSWRRDQLGRRVVGSVVLELGGELARDIADDQLLLAGLSPTTIDGLSTERRERLLWRLHADRLVEQQDWIASLPVASEARRQQLAHAVTMLDVALFPPDRPTR